MISLMPCFAYGTGIYLLNRLGEGFLAIGLGRVLKIDGRFFYLFLSTQIAFLLFVSVFGGAGLFSNDLKHNALQVYLSKPLTRFDYLIGKFVILLILLSFITLIPAVSLFLENALLSSNLIFLKTQYWLLQPIFLYSLLLILAHAFLIMTFSVLTRSSRYAAIAFGVVVLFSHIISQSLQGLFRGNRMFLIVSFIENLKRVGNKLFGLSPLSPLSRPLGPLSPESSEQWEFSLLVLVALIALCLLVLYRRIRGVEIVK